MIRNALGGKIFLCPSLDEGYLSGYSEAQFHEILDHLRQFSNTDVKVRTFRRAFLSAAAMYEPDAQGRINVSDELWEIIGAKAGEDICITYLFEKIEICAVKDSERLREKIPKLSEMDVRELHVPGI